jgi:hypothetical protein
VSLRARLTLFFVAIVVLPVAVAPGSCPAWGGPRQELQRLAASTLDADLTRARLLPLTARPGQAGAGRPGSSRIAA